MGPLEHLSWFNAEVWWKPNELTDGQTLMLNSEVDTRPEIQKLKGLYFIQPLVLQVHAQPKFMWKWKYLQLVVLGQAKECGYVH